MQTKKKSNQQIVRDYYKRLRLTYIMVFGLLPGLGVLFLYLCLIDNQLPWSNKLQEVFMTRGTTFILFSVMIIFGLAIGAYSFRCPICDSYTTGKRENANYCPTCKQNFDIDKFLDFARSSPNEICK